jgi:hypothetical protein
VVVNIDAGGEGASTAPAKNQKIHFLIVSYGIHRLAKLSEHSEIEDVQRWPLKGDESRSVFFCENYIHPSNLGLG